MEPISSIATTSVSTTVSQIAPWGIDITGIFFNLFGNSEASASFFSVSGILGFLNTVWSVYAILAFLASIGMLALYVHASAGRAHYYALSDEELREAEHAYDEIYRGIHKQDRLHDVLTHSSSDNPNDWKLAIIEADIILDETLKKRGYVGSSLGERLRNISPTQLQSLNDAWEAHKIRNRIAHEGADFVLTKRVADETINRYRRVFTEFGVH
jgi:hypothetical protein